MGWFRCGNYDGGGGDITLPTKFWQGLQVQFDELTELDDDTLYMINATVTQKSTYGYGNFVSKIYFGNKMVYPLTEEGWDWVIYDYVMPDANATTVGNNLDYDVHVPVGFQSSENLNKSWQIEFKATLTTGSVSGDQVIFGQPYYGTNILRFREVYLNSSGNLCMQGQGIPDGSYVTGASGHDIKMIYTNSSGTLDIYKDGTLERTISGLGPYSDMSAYELGICRYKSNYRFHGTLHYFKFKWLS